MGTRTKATEHALAYAQTELRDAVRQLALSAPAQIKWLKNLGTYPRADELGLEFDDAYHLLDQLVEAGRLSAIVAAELRRIDALLDEMSGVPENWTPEALRTDPRWAKVREIAGSVAKSI